MNRNKRVARQAAAMMAGVLTAQAAMVGAADEAALTKQETVYVKTNPAGETTEVIVSDWLKNTDGAGKISDRTDLENIENVKGEESFSRDGSSLVWDAQGSDIYYQGTTDKELPVAVHVAYYLDGEELAPEQLSGKSGHIRIVYSYENRAKNGDVYTPFVMVTGMILPAGHFRNVEVKNGRVVSDGERDIVIGMGVPGMSESMKLSETELLKDIELPSSFEVEADVTDFRTSMALTAASTLDLSELGLDDAESDEDIEELLDELTDAATQLVDGSGELADGVQTLKDSCVELVDGMNAVDENMGTLNDGLGTLNTKKQDLVEGVNALAAGIATLDGKKGELSGGVSKLYSGSKNLKNGAKQVNDGAKSIAENMKKLSEGADTLAAGSAALKDGSSALRAGTGSLSAGSGALLEGANELAAGGQTLQSGIKTYTDTVNLLLKNLAAQKKDITDKTDPTRPGYLQCVDTYVAGSTQLIGELMSQLNTVSQMMAQLVGGETAEKGEAAAFNDAAPAEETASAGNAAASYDMAAENARLQAENAQLRAELAALKGGEVNTASKAAPEAATGGATQAVQTISAEAQQELAAVQSKLREVESVVDAAKSPADLVKLSASYAGYVNDLHECVNRLDRAAAGITEQVISAAPNAGAAYEATGAETHAAVKEEAQIGAAMAASDTDAAAQLAALQQKLAAIQTAVENMQAAMEQKQPQLAAATANLNELRTAIASYEDGENGKPGLKAGIDGLLHQKDPATQATAAQALLGGVQSLTAGAQRLQAGAATLDSGAKQLDAGAIALDDGLAQALAAMPALTGGAAQLTTGAAQLAGGTDSLYAGSNALYSGLATLYASTGTLSSGIGQLADGAGALKSGTGTLAEGVAKLADGSTQLKEGTAQLADGGSKLNTGVGDLKDGADKLRDGMAEFNEEGIEKITDFFDDDVKELLERLRAVKEAGEEYRLFSDSAEDMDGSVKFIIETGEIGE